MAKRKKVLNIILGVVLAITLSQMLMANKMGINNDTVPASESHIKCKKYSYNHDGRRHVSEANSLLSEQYSGDSKSDLRKPNQNLLFVGVMTAAKYLDTRAKAVYETWGRQVPGKVVFFSSEFSYSEQIPLVALPGVDDSYPPQRKSFMMLKHMYDNYIDQYEWFLRADDDVYVRTDRLEELLRSVDSKKPWFIGQTGRGNTEEFGLLSLENDENFCMGGPGVILSRDTLKRMAPFVDECLANLYTTHEDVELGRCVRRFAGISCTWSYEMQVILYHNQSGQAAFSGDLKQKEVHRAITLHPVKQPHYMHRLHKYVKALKIQSYQQEMIHTHREIAASMEELRYHRNRLDKVELAPDLPLFPETRGSPGYLGDTNLLGVPQGLNRYKPPNLDNVIDWEFISKTLYSSRDLNPRRRIGTSIKDGLNDIVRDVMELINSYSKQRGRVIDFKDMLYGYWRYDPVNGVDLILDLLLVYRKYRGHKMTVQVRRHAYIQQTFAGIFVREVKLYDFPNYSQQPSSTKGIPIHKKIVEHIISTFEKNVQPIFSPLIANNNNNSNTAVAREETIHIILPLSGRHNTFKRFIKMYRSIRGADEAIKLIVILYKNDQFPGDLNKSRDLVDGVQNESSKDLGISLVFVGNETFSRARALEYGVRMLRDEDLMLFIDVDMIFDCKTLERLRLNTVRSKSVYFPIVYSLYNPKLLNKTYPDSDHLFYSQDIVDETSGFWRQFGFGIVSLYKSDYLDLGGFNLLISGWGFEDVNFYDSAVKSHIKIVRTIDPGLVHVYHPVHCDGGLDATQKNMCLGTQVSLVGSVHQLQEIYRKYVHRFKTR